MYIAKCNSVQTVVNCAYYVVIFGEGHNCTKYGIELAAKNINSTDISYL